MEELIVRYLQGEISDDELLELEAWVMFSQENKACFFQLKQIVDTSRRSAWSEEKKENSWQKMHTRMQILPEPKMEILSSLPRKSLFIRWMKYVALFLLALSIGWGVSEFLADTAIGNQKEETLVYHELQTEKGGRGNTLILSDGSKVTLNAATTLRYPAAFHKDNRTVYLDGEAYFEIAKNEEMPFVVKLPRQDITVLGTSFNVEAYKDEIYSIVTLFSGSVSLDAYDEYGESMSRMFLKPNQRAVANNQSGSVSVQNADVSLAEAWTKGKYKFKDEYLSVIAGRLEKYYNVEVTIEDESLKQTKFTGTFSLDQDIQEVLNVLDQENRYKVGRTGEKISIMKK